MQDYIMDNAYKLGTYTAIAQMMQREIRALHAAQKNDDEFLCFVHMRSLRSLADQLDAAEKEMQKEVDTVAG